MEIVCLQELFASRYFAQTRDDRLDTPSLCPAGFLVFLRNALRRIASC